MSDLPDIVPSSPGAFLIRRLDSPASRRRNLKALSTWTGTPDTVDTQGIYLIEFADDASCRQALAFLLRAGLDAHGVARPERHGVLLTTRDNALALLAGAGDPLENALIEGLLRVARGVDPAPEWALPDRRLPLDRPLIMGIINVTPDSFYDGGRYAAAEAAVDHGLKLLDEGADILDVGGQSSRPGSEAISSADEVARVAPVVTSLAAKTDVPISIDTYRADVARTCADAGATIVNDIQGLHGEKALVELIAARRLGAVIMHMRGMPGTMQTDIHYDDLVGEILWHLAAGVHRAHCAHIPGEALVIDPGIGFGKTVQDNLEIMDRLEEFHALGLPILVGASRKSFIGKTLGRDSQDRLSGTHATTALAVAAGARIIRVHDVAETKDVALMAHAIRRSTQLRRESPSCSTS